jgi:hypothetical protein
MFGQDLSQFLKMQSTRQKKDLGMVGCVDFVKARARLVRSSYRVKEKVWGISIRFEKGQRQNGSRPFNIHSTE